MSDSCADDRFDNFSNTGHECDGTVLIRLLFRNWSNLNINIVILVGTIKLVENVWKNTIGLKGGGS